MKYLSFVILLASSFAASAVKEDIKISRHRDLENDEPFKLLFQTTHERFQQDKEWCLTAKRNGIGSLIHVRECKQFDEDEVNLQLWERYDNDQLKLSDSSRNLCLRARHRRIYLHTCQEKADYRNSFIVDESSNYIEHDNDDGLQFLLGLRRSNVMGRVLLMQANTRSVVDNDTLTWNVRYMSQTSVSQTSAPTVSRSEPPSMLESATPSTPPSAWEIATSSPTTSPTKSPTSSPSNYPSFSPSFKSSPSSSPTVQGGGGVRTIPEPSPVESPTLSPSPVEIPTLSPNQIKNEEENAKENAKKKKTKKKKNKKGKKKKKKKKKKKTQP